MVAQACIWNQSESLDDGAGSLAAAAAGEAHMLGFGDPIAVSAETGLGMTELYEALRPLLEDHMLQVLKGKKPSLKCFPVVAKTSVLFTNSLDIFS